MSDNLKVITTSDGSSSLLNIEMNETYHSHHGALQESKHVFIDNGLKFLFEQQSVSEISIFEVGFGTGLNALLSLQEIFTLPVKINYTSLEAFPLEKEIWSQLNYADTLKLTEYYHRMHESAWDEKVNITNNFNLLKILGTLQHVNLIRPSYDLIFFDAFAPNKQAEMWTLPILEKVVHCMSQGGVFVTYCAKGQVKRDLKSLGLTVQTLPGPPGKMEMVRALKL